MKTLLTMLVLLSWTLGAPAVEPSAPAAGTVIGERVNMRAQPKKEAEVAGQLDDGAAVQIRSVTDEWVEVAPPASVDFYIHRDFIKDGKALVSKLIVRAGPGINYSKVGTLQKGAAVQVRGEFGDWVKIAPPPGSSLWISRPLVKMDMPKAVEPVVAVVKPPPPPVPPVVAVVAPPPPPPPPVVVPPPAPPRVVAKPAVEEPPPYVPGDLKLAPVENQGRSVQREGRVRSPVLTFSRPSRYQLMAERGTVSETVCYLRGNDEQLRSFDGRKLRVRGREYWVLGSRHPVVVVDQIMLVPE